MELQSKSTNPRVLLIWLKASATIYARLSRNIIREISPYFNPFPTLVWVNEDNILLCDLGSKRILPPRRFKNRYQKTFIQRNEGSRWTLLDANRVIISGGGCEVSAGLRYYTVGEPWTSAYVLCTTGQEARVLPTMLSGHCDHGLIVWKDAVLVFGSSSRPEGVKCESLQLTASQWTFLPELYQPRWDFTPVIWQEAVFLCGGMCSLIEMFNGVTINVLKLNLLQFGKAVACTQGENLLILTSKHLTTLSKSRKLTNMGHGRISINARANPVCYGGVIYQFYGKELHMFSATEGEELL
jgi:hypothetical protein